MSTAFLHRTPAGGNGGTATAPEEGDPGLVIGCGSRPSRLLGDPVDLLPADDELGHHIALILSDHPDVAGQFSAVDLLSMSTPEKWTLLTRINDLLVPEPVCIG